LLILNYYIDFMSARQSAPFCHRSI